MGKPPVTTQIGPFGLVPRWVIRGPLSAGAQRLYSCLADMADRETDTVTCGRPLLGRYLHVTVKTVGRMIEELELWGAVRVQRNRTEAGVNDRNRYTVVQVNPRPQWYADNGEFKWAEWDQAGGWKTISAGQGTGTEMSPLESGRDTGDPGGRDMDVPTGRDTGDPRGRDMDVPQYKNHLDKNQGTRTNTAVAVAPAASPILPSSPPSVPEPPVAAAGVTEAEAEVRGWVAYSGPMSLAEWCLDILKRPLVASPDAAAEQPPARKLTEQQARFELICALEGLDHAALSETETKKIASTAKRLGTLGAPEAEVRKRFAFMAAAWGDGIELTVNGLLANWSKFEKPRPMKAKGKGVVTAAPTRVEVDRVRGRDAELAALGFDPSLFHVASALNTAKKDGVDEWDVTAVAEWLRAHNVSAISVAS